MRIAALAAAFGLCVGMTGCTRVTEMSMPVHEKVNAAHPPIPEVKLAHERLLAMLGEDPKARDLLENQVDARMQLRAQSCSLKVSIGRLDTLADVKARALDPVCFQEQDKELQQFFGIRTVGWLLSRPALRPLKPFGPIGPLPNGSLSAGITSVAAARDAGVAVIRDGRGKAIVVELPGGKPVASLPSTGGSGWGEGKISPNGHVYFLHSGHDTTAFFDVGTGQRVWEASGNDRVLAWLPEVGGFILSHRSGAPLLADGMAGTAETHPLAVRNGSFAASIPGEPARTLLGSARELVLVDHKRTPQGIEATSVRQYSIGEGPGITSRQPVPMKSGRLVVYASGRDIGWLDLENGSSGIWKGSPYYGPSFAKLDETHLMIDSVEADRLTLKPWSFDITDQTVVPIDLGGPRGLIVDIGDRVGFVRRGEGAWFGDQVVTSGEALPMDKVLAAHQLQVQLAKLDAMSSAASNDGLGMSARPAVTTPASIDAGAGAPSALAPGLENVPKDALVHVVGVYEGQRGSEQSAGGHPRRPVRVVVRPSSRPVVLVLASYEPVNWMVANAGTRISAVLLSGYHPSTVVGIGETPVLRIGTASAHTPGGADYLQLRQAIARYTGAREIGSFQGLYSGSEFSIGGR